MEGAGVTQYITLKECGINPVGDSEQMQGSLSGRHRMCWIHPVGDKCEAHGIRRSGHLQKISAASLNSILRTEQDRTCNEKGNENRCTVILEGADSAKVDP